jgi:hypothetical protein
MPWIEKGGSNHLITVYEMSKFKWLGNRVANSKQSILNVLVFLMVAVQCVHY